MSEKINAERDAEMEPEGHVPAHPEAYWCVICGRPIAPEEQDDGSNLYVHDDKPHPEVMDFGEDERPQ